jgi:hypothetical protein
MTNLLTPTEAAQFVRTEETDAVLLQLLPLVDSYVQTATGRDWTADTEVHPLARAAAQVLTLSWYDNPLALGQGVDAVTPLLTQLEAEALKYRKVQFFGLTGAGSVGIAGAYEGDQVKKLVAVAGLSGDQSAKFESVITSTGALKQLDNSDLSEVLFVVILKSPGDEVTA